MSAYIIRDDALYQVTVGWSRTLHTFYAQIDDKQAGTWEAIGDREHAIGDMPRLQREIVQYAEIDKETKDKMFADRALNR